MFEAQNVHSASGWQGESPVTGEEAKTLLGLISKSG